MNLALVTIGQAGKHVPEGADVMIDVIHVAEMQLDHLLPELRIGLDGPGHASIHSRLVVVVGPHALFVDCRVILAH